MPLQEVHTGFTFNFDGSKMSAIQRGVKRASTGLNSAATHAARFQDKMGGAFARAGQLIGAYAGFRALKSLTSDYAKGADAVAKFSSGLGINAQEYQKLTFAAELSGITMEELNMALPKFAKSAADAADGSKAMADAFGRAGLKLKGGQFLGDPIDMLKAFSDGLKNVKDPIRKAQILQNSFGRAGKKMGVLMSQGSEGIKKAMEEAKKYGHVLSSGQLKAAEKYNDEMLRARSIMIGIRNAIASKLLPALTKQLTAFRTWWVEGRNAEHALRALKLVAIFTGIVIAQLFGASVIRNVKIFVQGIWAGVQALRAMGLAGAFAAIKIWAIIAAFALVALLIEDLIGFAQGKDSVIGRLLGDTSLAKDLKKSLLDLWKSIKNAWTEMKPALLDAWRALKPAVEDLWRVVRPLIGPAFRAGIFALIVSLEGLTGMINMVSTSVVMLTSLWAIGVDTVNSLLAKLSNTVKTVASVFGVDLGGAASSFKKAWSGGIGAVLGMLSPLVSAMNKALSLKNKLFGVSLGSLNLADKVKKNRERMIANAGMAPSAQPFFRATPQDTVFNGAPSTMPQPSFGNGFASKSINTNMASGAVAVTVHASGDPKQIAAEVSKQTGRAIKNVITSASRDLVKAPQGQR